jgi:hypothetical protein
MIALLWAILNVSLALYFVYVLIGFIAKGKRFFNTKYKFLAIAVLVIGIFQMASGSDSEEKNKSNFLKNNQIPTVTYYAKMLTIEEDLSFDTKLLVKYYIDQNEIVLDNSSSSLIGFVSGFDWKLTSTELKLNRNNDPTYTVNGVLSWKLFNITIFKQHKHFHGTIE